jgi:CMP-N,N'-diacetyllegionaminic acid synthase
MFKGKRIIAVIPARGGSKGIRLKNLQTIGGLSLVAHTGKFCQQLGMIDCIHVSTDHQLIKKEAEKLQLDCPYLRPPELSHDQAGDLGVLQYALFFYQKHLSRSFDILLMLQPTALFREKTDITECLNKIIEEGHLSAWTLTSIDKKHHPLKQLEMQEGSGQISLVNQAGHQITARQQLSSTYIRNGLCYAFDVPTLLYSRNLLFESCAGVLTNRCSINIDTAEDLKQARDLWKNLNPQRKKQNELIPRD